MNLIRITDESTEAELMECLAHLSRSPHTEVRTARCDAVLD